MRCLPVGNAVEIITPFTFADGDGVGVFAQTLGPQVLFFDDGFTLQHLSSVGIDVGFNKKRWQPLRSITKTYGVSLSDQGIFETLCPANNPSQGFARIISTILGVAHWEKEQAGVSQDAAWFIDEVALYLKAWKPKAALSERPSARGFSGRTLSFDFELDGQFVDAIHSHSASTGAELRKIIDLHSNSAYSSKEVLVIVDDRQGLDGAKQEMAIIGQVATAWGISALMRASGGGATAQ